VRRSGDFGVRRSTAARARSRFARLTAVARLQHVEHRAGGRVNDQDTHERDQRDGENVGNHGNSPTIATAWRVESIKHKNSNGNRKDALTNGESKSILCGEIT
jgi:hypothetical protein